MVAAAAARRWLPLALWLQRCVACSAAAAVHTHACTRAHARTHAHAHTHLQFDNRGSYNRGTAFERTLWKRMGTVEVEDQVAGVGWLERVGVTHPDHVGIHGWSYGGYMTLMCLARSPDVFKVGVAGAPVTAWEFYDTAYTERYMALPSTNDHYGASSVLRLAPNLVGKEFLVIHGNIDENVHYRNSTALVAALAAAQAAGTPLAHVRAQHAMLELPGERHSARGLVAAVRNETVSFLTAALLRPTSASASASAVA